MMSVFFSSLEKIGGHLTKEEVKLLLFLTGNSLPNSVKRKIHNGEDLMLALVSAGIWSDKDFPPLLRLLCRIGRYDLLQMLQLSEDSRVPFDQLEENFHHGGKASENGKSSIADGRRRTKCSRRAADEPSTDEPPSKKVKPTETLESEQKGDQDADSESFTCDVQLRVRVECNKMDSILEGQVSSNKNDPIERSLELFTQANTVLMSRDLGYIVCNIKFSELSYLDAFWRDYLNGSLQEALKDVFITEALKRTVGTSDLVLLASVSEEDYRNGRKVLMRNHTEDRW